jgi:ATP-binding cassette subfamily B protein
VFQKFQKYKMTLDDNVKISQIKKGKPIDDNALETGIDINNADIYPNGIDTMLSREFDGVDLSGGQWQRVALARGFYRDHKLIVLDEPTAAIDPLEETKIYKQFMDIAKDKTAVIITHRMGSAKLADRIVVMDNGRIDDIGTHEELMRRGGLYYEMFTAQSVWYDREAVVL